MFQEAQVLRYILDVLLQDCPADIIEASKRQIYYVNHDAPTKPNTITIRKSNFFQPDVFETNASLPNEQLQLLESIPILYGTTKLTLGSDCVDTEADIVASAFFMLSRHEELVRRDIRDDHGRFPGVQSFAFRHGFLNTPIVDQYSELLKGWLRQIGIDIPETKSGIKKVVLTHDADEPFRWNRIRNVAADSMKHLKSKGIVTRLMPILSYLNLSRKDPYYTFDYIFEHAKSLESVLGSDHVQSIHFVMSGGSYHKMDVIACKA